jgi:hypothetical protein
VSADSTEPIRFLPKISAVARPAPLSSFSPMLATSIRGLAAHTSRTASAVIFGSSRSDLGRSAASCFSCAQVTAGTGAGRASTGVSSAGDFEVCHGRTPKKLGG